MNFSISFRSLYCGISCPPTPIKAVWPNFFFSPTNSELLATHYFLQWYTKVCFAWLLGTVRGWAALGLCAVPGWWLLKHMSAEHCTQAGPGVLLHQCNDNAKQHSKSCKGDKFFWWVLANFIHLVLRHRIMFLVKVSDTDLNGKFTEVF